VQVRSDANRRKWIIKRRYWGYGQHLKSKKVKLCLTGEFNSLVVATWTSCGAGSSSNPCPSIYRRLSGPAKAIGARPTGPAGTVSSLEVRPCTGRGAVGPPRPRRGRRRSALEGGVVAGAAAPLRFSRVGGADPVSAAVAGRCARPRCLQVLLLGTADTPCRREVDV